MTPTLFLQCTLLVTLGLGAGAGCRTVRVASLDPDRVSQPVVSKQPTASAEHVEIVYEAHPSNGAAFKPVEEKPSDRGIIPSSHVTETDSSDHQWAIAKLSIQYPHPDGRLNYARATVELKGVDCGNFCDRKSLAAKHDDRVQDRKERWNDRAVQWFYRWKPTSEEPPPGAVAVLDIPKAEIDILIEQLRKEGFFESRGETGGPAKVAVQQNRRKTTRNWTYEPALDDLVERVWSEGHVANHKPVVEPLILPVGFEEIADPADECRQ